jgi:hypothetical protein
MAVSKKLPPFDSKLVSVDPDTLEEASFAMGKSMKHKTPITPKTPKKVPEFLQHLFIFIFSCTCPKSLLHSESKVGAGLYLTSCSKG